MRAAVLYQDGIKCSEVQEPSIQDCYVKVKVAYCGICGSDLPRVLNGKAHHYPIILGHEFTGVITETGKNVDNVVINDRIVCVPLMPCFECENCSKGLFSLCNNYRFIGSRVDGGYGEYVCIPAKNVLKIPDTLDLKDAATIEPCTVARHAFELTSVKNRKVAIIGSGIIGLYAVQWSKKKGASSTVLVTHGNKEMKTDEVMADIIISDENIQNVKADVIIDCAGTNDSLIESMAMANPRGSVILVGTPKNSVTFSVKEWEIINRKELSVIGSWMSYSGTFPGTEWEDTIQSLKDGSIKIVKHMIDEIVDIEDVSQTFERMRDRKSRGRILLALDKKLQ